jgi:hypothetical protein
MVRETILDCKFFIDKCSHYANLIYDIVEEPIGTPIFSGPINIIPGNKINVDIYRKFLGIYKQLKVIIKDASSGHKITEKIFETGGIIIDSSTSFNSTISGGKIIPSNIFNTINGEIITNISDLEKFELDVPHYIVNFSSRPDSPTDTVIYECWTSNKYEQYSSSLKFINKL